MIFDFAKSRWIEMKQESSDIRFSDKLVECCLNFGRSSQTIAGNRYNLIFKDNPEHSRTFDRFYKRWIKLKKRLEETKGSLVAINMASLFLFEPLI